MPEKIDPRAIVPQSQMASFETLHRASIADRRESSRSNGEQQELLDLEDQDPERWDGMS